MISSNAFARTFAPDSNGSERATTRKDQWFVATRAGIFPMTAAAIEESLQRGVLHATTKVWTSGMRAWESLGSIAAFRLGSLQPVAPPRRRPSDGARARAAHTLARERAPQPDAPSNPPSSYAPLPALGNLSWGPASVTPAPAPLHTLIRRRVEVRSSRRSLPHWSARALSWVRSRQTWQIVLLSLVAGTALGLVTYHPLLWGPATPSTDPSLASAASLPPRAPRALAATPPMTPAPPLERPEARADNTVHSATVVTPPASARPTPQAKRSPAKRSKTAAARRRTRRPAHSVPEWP
ncbi:MAG: GYF domain-containing protein [Deltaproteobacteria bacterium]